jgi:hypothetical protein
VTSTGILTVSCSSFEGPKAALLVRAELVLVDRLRGCFHVDGN